MITLVEVRPAWDTLCDMRCYYVCPLNVCGSQVNHDISKTVYYDIMEAVKEVCNEFSGTSISILKVLA